MVVGESCKPSFRTTVVSGVILAALYFACPANHTVIKTILKAIPVATLSALTFAHGSGSGSGSGSDSYSLLIGTGLLFGSLGDVFLELHIDGLNCFLVGLVLFLVGHLCYVKAFCSCGVSFSHRNSKITLALCISAFVCIESILLTSSSDTSLAAPLLAYGAVLCSTAFSAIARYVAYAGSAAALRSRLAAMVGGVLFVASDTSLAFNAFCCSFPGAEYCIMITYYAAQILIAASVCNHRGEVEGDGTRDSLAGVLVRYTDAGSIPPDSIRSDSSYGHSGRNRSCSDKVERLDSAEPLLQANP